MRSFCIESRSAFVGSAAGGAACTVVVDPEGGDDEGEGEGEGGGRVGDGEAEDGESDGDGEGLDGRGVAVLDEEAVATGLEARSGLRTPRTAVFLFAKLGASQRFQ